MGNRISNKTKKKQSPQNKMAAEAVHQTFETETTLTTFEVKTMTTEVTEVVEMRNKAQPTNAVEDAIRGHFGDGVVDLIYWKDIKKSAGVAASSLILLISLSIFSVLSVISYISLAVLTVTFSFAVYKRTLAAIQKSDAGHPFGQYLEMDLSISPEKAQEYAEIISSYMATYVRTILGDGFEHQPGEGPRIRRNHLFLHGDLRWRTPPPGSRRRHDRLHQVRHLPLGDDLHRRLVQRTHAAYPRSRFYVLSSQDL